MVSGSGSGTVRVSKPFHRSTESYELFRAFPHVPISRVTPAFDATVNCQCHINTIVSCTQSIDRARHMQYYRCHGLNVKRIRGCHLFKPFHPLIAQRIITGCMRPTETTFLPVLAGITPPDIRREARVAKLTATAKNNSDHLLHHKVTAADAACPQRLVSRRPFSRHPARLSNDNYDPAKAWSDLVDRGEGSTPHSDRLPSAYNCDTSWGRSPPQAVGETNISV